MWASYKVTQFTVICAVSFTEKLNVTNKALLIERVEKYDHCQSNESLDVPTRRFGHFSLCKCKTLHLIESA